MAVVMPVVVLSTKRQAHQNVSTAKTSAMTSREPSPGYIIIEGVDTVSYDAGHSWYYKLGGKVLSVTEIEPYNVTDTDYKRIRKTYKTDVEMLNSFRNDLAIDIAQYNSLKENGAAALSQYDIRMQGEEAALHTALSLKHNHISFHKGYIHYIENNRMPSTQGILF